MWRVPDLSLRVREPELMDDPAIDPAEHRRALAGLARLNRFGDSVGALWEEIGPMAKTPGHAGLSVLDIATGSGDVPVALARLARKAAVTLSLSACDVSATALAAAGKRAEQYGIALATFQLDAIRQEIPGEYDIVMCSLFTHHLEEDQVVGLLYRMKAAARKMVLVNDLVRTSGSYRLAVAGSRLLSRSRVVHVDAAKSMRAAFTVQEFEELAEEAGLSGARVERRRPCRFLLSWRRER
jgi:2-polyprenyl-3-methyl-5-hydroxy-6-metoxy-1,4-benzoquinol methylase